VSPPHPRPEGGREEKPCEDGRETAAAGGERGPSRGDDSGQAGTPPERRGGRSKPSVSARRAPGPWRRARGSHLRLEIAVGRIQPGARDLPVRAAQLQTVPLGAGQRTQRHRLERAPRLRWRSRRLRLRFLGAGCTLRGEERLRRAAGVRGDARLTQPHGTATHRHPALEGSGALRPRPGWDGAVPRDAQALTLAVLFSPPPDETLHRFSRCGKKPRRSAPASSRGMPQLPAMPRGGWRG